MRSPPSSSCRKRHLDECDELLCLCLHGLILGWAFMGPQLCWENQPAVRTTLLKGFSCFHREVQYILLWETLGHKLQSSLASVSNFWVSCTVRGAVLLGDAAHSTGGASGQGCNSALQDCQLDSWHRYQASQLILGH